MAMETRARDTGFRRHRKGRWELHLAAAECGPGEHHTLDARSRRRRNEVITIHQEKNPLKNNKVFAVR